MRAAAFLLLVHGLLVLPSCGDPSPSGSEPSAPAALGEAVDLSMKLEDARRANHRVAIDQLAGQRATVLLAWSVPCPCVEAVEARVQALIERFGADRGVGWVAIDGEPRDTREQVREKLLRLDVPYPVLLDPTQAACRRIGLTTATQVAIVDAKGRLAYRGALDENLAIGKGEHVAAVLQALLEDRKPTHAEQPLKYGCDFDDAEGAARLR